MGAMKDLLIDFNESIDNARDETENIKETLYNLNLPYGIYHMVLQNIEAILEDISELQVDVKNQLEALNKLDYTE